MSTSASVNPLNEPIPPINLSYTALVATLVLLLAVSSAIVIRSLVLRRRHQRLVEEAIRAGTWNPNQAYDPHSGRRRREIGEKPKLWETWLRNGEDGDNTTEKGRWDDIMPVHAAYLDLSSPSAPAPTNDPVSRSESPPRTSRFLRPFQRRAPPSPSPPVISPPIDSSSADISPRSRSPSPTVRLAVLIAMPSPPPQHTREDDGPPIVEIGITDVVVRDSDCEHTPDL
ncbi:hypothetical protein BJ138DRAFT_1112834 [Hygrophoropsis aurantiaca]|uniref:Uncharacterized protein n=1 Tax=Hygrophoropsis aurantiaca TaxID=72124 RepID=A0ACB8AEY9_9AGAM|nr:hypothetical protein BJ138DRAFT_1112834 [Hygrophoropsis aurantiaca]